jgi:hypothetical protein
MRARAFRQVVTLWVWLKSVDRGLKDPSGYIVAVEQRETEIRVENLLAFFSSLLWVMSDVPLPASRLLAN